MLFPKFRRFAPVLLVSTAIGCFNYSDTPRGDPIPAGRDVRLELTGAGRVVLAPQLGPQVRTVYGRLVSIDTAGSTVRLERTTLVDGTDAPWNGETITISSQYIADSQERRISAPKTVGLLALVSGAIVGVSLAFARGSSSGASSVSGSGGH